MDNLLIAGIIQARLDSSLRAFGKYWTEK